MVGGVAQQYLHILDHLLNHSRCQPALRLVGDDVSRWQVGGSIRHGASVRKREHSLLVTSRRGELHCGADLSIRVREGTTTAHSSSAPSLG